MLLFAGLREMVGEKELDIELPEGSSLDELMRELERAHAALDQAIVHLEYEVYGPMAEKELQKILARARERWPDVRLALCHRVGRLEIGDAAVMVAAAAPHRAEAFEACRFAIDTLKESVPIWKKEFAEGGA